LKEQHLRNIGMAGSSDTNIINDFKFHLGQRYQLILAKMRNYMTQVPKTASTVADQQYYHYPAGIVDVEGCVVTVGSVNYPLSVVTSQFTWDNLNAMDIQASTIPQFIYPRRDDFGIWPIPQAVYTITFNYHLRDRNLTVEDYTTGSVTATNASTTITGSGTAFTAAMAGRWFCVTSTTNTGEGYFYRIAGYTNATTITLENGFEGATASSLSYKIGQSPEIPEEGHIILADGTASDYYAGMRSDITTATWWNNKSWTGDGNNNSRKEGDKDVAGGLIGLMKDYADRNNQRLIQRKPKTQSLSYKVWATTLT
jgi:hypothetical protein